MLTRVSRLFCNSHNLHTRLKSQSKYIHGLVKISKTEQQGLLLVLHNRYVDTESDYTIVIFSLCGKVALYMVFEVKRYAPFDFCRHGTVLLFAVKRYVHQLLSFVDSFSHLQSSDTWLLMFVDK